jgi:hypothetical protein
MKQLKKFESFDNDKGMRNLSRSEIQFISKTLLGGRILEMGHTTHTRLEFITKRIEAVEGKHEYYVIGDPSRKRYEGVESLLHAYADACIFHIVNNKTRGFDKEVSTSD